MSMVISTSRESGPIGRSGFFNGQHNVGHYVDCQEGFRHDFGMAGDAPDPNTARVTLAIAGFLDACRSSNTRSAYRTDLRHVAAWCRGREALDLLTIDAADVVRYRTECELAGASPATVARRLSALTSFGAYAAANGGAPALTADSEIARPTVESSSSAELLTDGDAEVLLAAADRIGRRAAVLIRLLMLDGLKVGEVIRADASDVSGRPPRMTLQLHDRRARTIDLHPDTGSAMRRYLGDRREGPLLLSERRGREPGRLTRFGLDYLVKQVAHAAGLEQSVSGNTLRRRYVIAADADGTDLDEIRDNAGHADRRTTRRYLNPDATAQD
jgi:integrase/recombinase XerD